MTAEVSYAETLLGRLGDLVFGAVVQPLRGRP